LRKGDLSAWKNRIYEILSIRRVMISHALRRWSRVQPQENFLHDDEEEAYACSPTACLLGQADLSPESEDGDKDVDVDL